MLPLVYGELRRLADGHLRRERIDHTLNPTALVHEAYLKLSEQTRVRWESRGHFLAIAATAMRRILIDHARTKSRMKRAADGQRVAYPEDLAVGAAVNRPASSARSDASSEAGLDLLALDAALRRLEDVDPRKARVIDMRFFAGMTIEAIADALDIAPATVKRDWDFARLWLLAALDDREATRG